MNEVTQDAKSPWGSWPIDLEIVFASVINAKRESVFKAWTDPSHIVKWFGPKGWVTETHEIDICVGGVWRFDMVAPDGTRHGNRMKFLRIEHPTLPPKRRLQRALSTPQTGTDQLLSTSELFLALS